MISDIVFVPIAVNSAKPFTNQADAQRHWRDGHKDYWRQYRADHPWYTQRNRRLQSQRNKRITGKRPLTQNVPLKIAKMDAQPIDFQGTYILTAVCGEGEDSIANMDGCVVRYQGLLQLTTEMHDRFKTEFDRIDREGRRDVACVVEGAAP